MSLTAADVAEIMRLLEGSSFDELNLEVDGMKISLRRNGPAPVVERSAGHGAGPAAASAAPAAPPSVSSSAATRPAPAADPTLGDISSPLLGTFYRAPKPGAPPFVDVGMPVEPETVVAIVEVMKLMNTVRAGMHGTVTEILARDGELVEYGQALMRVRRAG
jgi:acetyl-CoA carboxylase biotin carboxyl carrier protein